MLATELISLLAEVVGQVGDREITLVNEETGEVRYVVAISCDINGSALELEHVSFEEKQFIDLMNLAEHLG
jgi:hypothetical protein